MTLRKAIHSLIVLNIQLAEKLRSANSIFCWFVGQRKSSGPYFRASGRRHPSCVDLKWRLPSDDIARSVSHSWSRPNYPNVVQGDLAQLDLESQGGSRGKICRRWAEALLLPGYL
jgi:hypothetical protein